MFQLINTSPQLQFSINNISQLIYKNLLQGIHPPEVFLESVYCVSDTKNILAFAHWPLPLVTYSQKNQNNK